MGYSQLPEVIIQPKDGKGKDYFVEARKKDTTVKGVLGLALLGVTIVVIYSTFRTSYWFVGMVLLALTIIFFGWTIITNKVPIQTKEHPRRD